MLPEIEAALDYWREVNSSRNHWATFEAVQFPQQLAIQVKCGITHHKGSSYEFKESPIKAKIFIFEDNRVQTYDIVNA